MNSLAELHAALPPTVTEISTPCTECPIPQQWAMWDGMATEYEVLSFLYSLVRLLKPKTIIETGTYLGYGTAHLALAAKHNGFGDVITADPDHEVSGRAARMLSSLGIADRVSFIWGTGLQMIMAQGLIDFAFLDSNCHTRIEEMEVLLPRLHEGSMVAVHDASVFHDIHNRGPRTPFTNFAKENGMEFMHFNTPRGLMLLRRKPLV